MRALIETDVHTFLGRAGPWLAREPVANNVLNSVAEANRDGRQQHEGAIWVTVLDDAGEVTGAAMHTPPHRLFVCRMPDEALRAVVEAVVAQRPDLVGVVGVSETVTAFAEQWQQVTGATSAAGVDQRLYSLADVTSPHGVPGRPRPATPADRDVLLAWSQAFHDEAVPDQPSEDLAAVVDRRIGDGTYRVWEVDGRAVSFAGFSPPSAGVSRIGPVYTPPADRGHGYASAVTAAATRHTLDGGAAYCMLYTDLANPTANAIYQALGYRPVCDAREYAFTYPAGTAAS